MHVARPVQVSFGLGVVTMEQQWRARFVQYVASRAGPRGRRRPLGFGFGLGLLGVGVGSGKGQG